MAKSQLRGNREQKKPKQDKKRPASPSSGFSSPALGTVQNSKNKK